LGNDGSTPGITFRARHLLVVAFVLPVLVAGAYFLGTTRPMVWTHTGMAQSAEGAISVEVDGWTYNIPLDVEWRDANHSWHDSGRPDCLLPANVNVPVTFGSVDVTGGGLGWRQVVWVACPDDVLSSQ
jgi:hypothetical protein